MPIQKIIEEIKTKSRSFWAFLKVYNPITKARLVKVGRFLRENRRSVAIMLPVLILVYYVVGGWATNKIDKNTAFLYPHTNDGLEVIDASAALIKREVDDHMWTANLPFIFPGYVLDNMPQFQKGIVKTVQLTVKEIADYDDDSSELQNAEKLLRYPGNIWLLSKTENLSLAPSSGAQYRKARKELLKYNQDLKAQGRPNDELLLEILTRFGKDSLKISAALEKQVREHGTDWTDFQADDVFYYNQGRLYGYYVIIKALGEDFKDEIVAADVYGKLTSILKTLEDSLRLDPLLIRNGQIDSVIAPNHLVALNYYTVKVHSQLQDFIAGLREEK